MNTQFCAHKNDFMNACINQNTFQYKWNTYVLKKYEKFLARSISNVFYDSNAYKHA